MADFYLQNGGNIYATSSRRQRQQTEPSQANDNVFDDDEPVEMRRNRGSNQTSNSGASPSYSRGTRTLSRTKSQADDVCGGDRITLRVRTGAACRSGIFEDTQAARFTLTIHKRYKYSWAGNGEPVEPMPVSVSPSPREPTVKERLRPPRDQAVMDRCVSLLTLHTMTLDESALLSQTIVREETKELLPPSPPPPLPEVAVEVHRQKAVTSKAQKGPRPVKTFVSRGCYAAGAMLRNVQSQTDSIGGPPNTIWQSAPYILLCSELVPDSNFALSTPSSPDIAVSQANGAKKAPPKPPARHSSLAYRTSGTGLPTPTGSQTALTNGQTHRVPKLLSNGPPYAGSPMRHATLNNGGGEGRGGASQTELKTNALSVRDVTSARCARAIPPEANPDDHPLDEAGLEAEPFESRISEPENKPQAPNWSASEQTNVANVHELGVQTSRAQFSSCAYVQKGGEIELASFAVNTEGIALADFASGVDLDLLTRADILSDAPLSRQQAPAAATKSICMPPGDEFPVCVPSKALVSFGKSPSVSQELLRDRLVSAAVTATTNTQRPEERLDCALQTEPLRFRREVLVQKGASLGAGAAARSQCAEVTRPTGSRVGATEDHAFVCSGPTILLPVEHSPEAIATVEQKAQTEREVQRAHWCAPSVGSTSDDECAHATDQKTWLHENSESLSLECPTLTDPDLSETASTPLTRPTASPLFDGGGKTGTQAALELSCGECGVREPEPEPTSESEPVSEPETEIDEKLLLRRRSSTTHSIKFDIHLVLNPATAHSSEQEFLDYQDAVARNIVDVTHGIYRGADGTIPIVQAVFTGMHVL